MAIPSAPTRAAHTLRGTAGNIGATDVQVAAAALEGACLADAPAEVIDLLLANTLAALQPVIDGLAELRPDLKPVTGSDRTEKATVRVLAARLTALLEDSNLEAGDAAEELAAAVSGTALAEAATGVSQAVARFDVDAALDALRSLTVSIERI